MKRYIPYSGLFTVVVLLLTGLISGCIKDDRDNCDTETATSYRLIVKTLESDSVQQGDIREVVLFIFDKDQKFIGSKETMIDQITELTYPSNNELYVVAWGNSKGTNQSVSDPTTNQFLQDIHLQLAMKDDQYTLSPDDLFQGAKLITPTNESSSPDILWIKRKIAKVTIIARGLKPYFNTTDSDFKYVVRGTNNTLDLAGFLAGTEAYLQPDATFDGNQDFRTTSFHVFPTEKLAVDIYKADQLVYTIDRDDSGNPFIAPEGKNLAILIDFAGNVQITISINDWEHTDVSGGL